MAKSQCSESKYFQELYSEMERLYEAKKELAKVDEEMYDLESSRQSCSHAGPTLALRSLRRKKELLEIEIQTIQFHLLKEDK